MHRHALVDRDDERVEPDADQHDRHAAHENVAGAEADEHDVGRDEKSEPEVVPPGTRNEVGIEEELEGETEREQPTPAPGRVGESAVAAAREERGQRGDEDHEAEKRHAARVTSPDANSAEGVGEPPRQHTMRFVSETEVRFEVDGAVARVTIDRPERRNAMSFGVMQGLLDAMQRARSDDAVRVVVLTGAGDRAFCAGADLGGIAENAGPAAVHDARGLLADLFRSMYGLGKPTIARVRGYALAGGFGLACACDLVIAADDAVFGTPEIDVGLWPYMITVPLLRSLPPKRVLELMMTGRRVDAVEAERLGFVTRVVPVAELDTAVDELAATLASKSPLIMRWGRDAFYRVLEQPDSDAALAYLQTMLSITTQTEDAAEGVAAFAQKRTPEWRGR